MDEALKRIEAARQNQSTTLDLVGLQLTTLPESLWQLTALKSLWLTNNYFAVLPEWLGNLTALQTLDLRDSPNLCRASP